MRLSRRDLIAGLGAALSGPALADAPISSRRPLPRVEGFHKIALPAAEELVARSGLTGQVAFAVADATTGQLLESRNPDLRLPPASTAKALTTLYAMDRLGPDHRFETTLRATGPIRNGRIEGDLILAGGGDPVLDTDGLMEMADALKEAGVREVGGHLKVWTGALPDVHEIDEEQPDHVGYNPAICGLNLNYNRVYFGWKRRGDDYEVSMDARSGALVPGVEVARMSVVDRSGPIYTYTRSDAFDDWTVARTALGEGGGRWLPVRHPGLYAGEVFQTLARSHGILTAGPVQVSDRAEGEVLHRRESARLEVIARDMLRYSTNLTAEVVGMNATKEGGRVPSLPASARQMNAWLAERFGTGQIALEDHSGLGDDSVVTAADMVRAMAGSGPDGGLRPLLKEFALEDGRFQVDAKTGTLNFVSALTGFVSGPSGPPLAFAILCADLPQRETLSVEQRERPEGGRRWNGAARWLQRALLERWGGVYLT